MASRILCGMMLAVSLAGGAFLTSAHAQGAAIGSSNVAPLEPDAPRPAGAPCVVTLADAVTFGASEATFSYTPPAACPAPWSKVILATDIAVNPGRQFDRTATLFLGGVPLFFGTTSEPRAALGPSWHRERDVTEDTALLKSAQIGQMLIVNYQDSTYTSTITASARLLFYPADRFHPAPVVPDAVIPMGSDPRGVTTTLATGQATLSRTLTLPRNIVQAHYEAYLQNQSSDEFYYTCTTDALAASLQNCGGGTFREGQVSVDGRLAGLAPVYPSIFTGGLDPYLWEPTPGVHTLQFEPQQVELTPFAGSLNDGKPHTFALSVNGANNYFSVTGALYLTYDHGLGIVRGGLERDTLAVTVPSSSNTIQTLAATQTTSGNVTITANNQYQVSGYLWTSKGLVETVVDARAAYSNNQNYVVTGSTVYDQTIAQDTTFDTTVTRIDLLGGHVTHRSQHFPLQLTYDYNMAADGSASQLTKVDQGLHDAVSRVWNHILLQRAVVDERIAPQDTLIFNASGTLVSHTGSSTGQYDARGGGTCTTRKTAASNAVLTAWSTETRPCVGAF